MGKQTIRTETLHSEDLPENLLERLKNTPEHFCHYKQHIYLYLDGLILCSPDEPAAREMFNSIMHHKCRTNRQLCNEAEIIGRILTEPDFNQDSVRFNLSEILPGGQCCVTVFQTFSPLREDLFSVLKSIAPVEKGDLIIEIDYRTVSFIRQIRDDQLEELAEYTEALIGSMETEGFTGIKAGIGGAARDIKGMRNSYLEGSSALYTGMKYHPDEQVFIYSKQLLERIVDSIPTEKKKDLRDQFFRKGIDRTVNDELLETVRVFFQNDLNLTAASRQLFIHRNTLNYRLDKVKKEFGLDLRIFQDAVIFRIISEIPEDK